MNTKHKGKHSEKMVCKSKCSLCEDTFETKNDFEMHLKEHIVEIEELDIEKITNGHYLFECNLCSFESEYDDSIREHLIHHVNHSRNDEKENEESEQAAHPVRKYLLDEYDQYGNYIGDDPALMDSDRETDEDDS